MRATVFAALFAAGAIAGPMHHHNKRELVVKTEYDYVTAYVYKTVAEGYTEPTPVVSQAPIEPLAISTPTPTPSPKVFKAPVKAPSPSPSPAPVVNSPAPQVVSSSAPSAPAHVSGPSDFATKVLLHHNAHRANHSAPAIEWSSDLEASAQMVADTCIYEHNTDMLGGNYGQNIAAGASDIGDVITGMFYNGEVNNFNAYGQPDPTDGFLTWGHFSQVVWKSTTHVACVMKDCTAQHLGGIGGGIPPIFTVCNYKTGGNMGGAYAENIGYPLGHPSIDASYSG